MKIKSDNKLHEKQLGNYCTKIFISHENERFFFLKKTVNFCWFLLNSRGLSLIKQTKEKFSFFSCVMNLNSN